ncbi:D-allose transporter substrate-binding protein [Pseudomonas gingeri]|uniref:D-allose transporter substrate-binding protein n=2 Tax=Pseudomonas gingeri TaxID=117681 RepID=A0A7Y7YD05_9PSED|nr:D-allose transporter substrate-binding protein [Pseudomonas gingeri]NWA13643.1 D-allose transporter substrate-binding protein [Pseudomonas gingeri]NWA52997.1 D-allose transporter substrate-binding protein [Pseudomonas gingeri]NWA96494.1 D-allose transporter substrate-binding protein [Pseudomonas gingeri]NWA99869.1 D-allose transporter substrate-binding protein [Pseudomonas gingeri]
MVAVLMGGCLLLGSLQQAMAAQADYAVILKTLANPYWISMRDGIEQEAKAKGVTVDIFAAGSEDDIQGQQRLLEDAINKNYKAIGVAPITAVSLVQPIAAASRKGVYIVNLDEKVDVEQLKAAGGSVVAFLATDNKLVGKKGGQYIVDRLGAGGGKVAIIEGKAGNATGDARRDGAAEAFKGWDRIKVVASQPADWDRARALDVTTNILQRNPDLKGIYAANDTMALGAVQAVRNANLQGQVIVVGTDGAPEALDSVKNGELTATVAQDSAAMGARGLDIMIDTLKNKPAISVENAAQFIAIDSHLITQGQ